MRVVSVAFTQYRRDGRVRRACEALAARGDEVTALTLAEPGLPDREEVAGVRVERIPVERLTHTTRQTKARYLFEYGAYAAAVARRLVALHREAPLDLVHVNDMPDALVFAAAPVKALGVPVLLDVHDLMPDLYVNKFGGDARGPVVRALIAQIRASAAFADAVLTVHDEAKALLEGYGVPGARVEVVLNSADDRVFRWRGFKAPSDPFVLTYHGSLSRRHGLDLALRAVARARPRLPAALRFDIVGEGDAVDEIRRLVTGLGLEDVVRLTPRFLPVEALPGFLAEADLAVAPYRRDAATDLMLPSKVFDYGAVGIPVVLSRLRCAARYFEEGEVREVPAGDVDALADALVALAGDPDRRRGLVEALRAKVDRLSWPVQRARYLALVDRLAASRAGGTLPAVAATVRDGALGLLSPPPDPRW